VDWLLEQGLSPCESGDTGQMPLHAISWHAVSDLPVDLERDDEGDGDSANITIYIIDALVRAGSDINAEDQDGNTALHLAVHCFAFDPSSDGANPIAARALLERGADPNHRNKLGETPLHFAVRGVSEDGGDGLTCVRILLQYGANPDLIDNDGIGVFNYLENLSDHWAQEGSANSEKFTKRNNCLISLVRPCRDWNQEADYCRFAHHLFDG